MTEGGAPAGFASKATVLGLPTDCYGKVVILRREAYTIEGVNLRARKYPVMVRRVSDGKTYKWADGAVLRALNEAEVAA